MAYFFKFHLASILLVITCILADKMPTVGYIICASCGLGSCWRHSTATYLGHFISLVSVQSQPVSNVVLFFLNQFPSPILHDRFCSLEKKMSSLFSEPVPRHPSSSSDNLAFYFMLASKPTNERAFNSLPPKYQASQYL